MVRLVFLVAVLALGLTPGSPVEAQPPLPPLQIVDTSVPQGSASFPTRLAVDAAGTMYVIDAARGHVKVFDPAGVHVRDIGSPGSGDGQFDTPVDVALTRDGQFLYVADSGHSRVQKFDAATGAFVLKFGQAGQLPGQFHDGIMALTVDRTGTVYVGSVFQLQKFDANGALLGAFDLGGILPWAMAVDAHDNLVFFEADGGGFRTYDPAGTSLGSFWRGACHLSDGSGCVDPDGAGPLESGDGQLAWRPAALAVDPSGDLHVTDGPNFRIQTLGPDGAFRWKLGHHGTGDGQFGGTESVGPWGMAVDGAGRLYVTDPENHRIQIFADGFPALSIDSVTVMEGHAGTTPAVFTVTLTPASPSTVTVDYITADQTALAGTDYTLTQGRLTFAPGETTKPISVPVLGDTAVDGAKRFLVVLSGPTNATLAVPQGAGDILDDDLLPAISIADARRREGNRADRTLVFTLSLSAPAPVPVTVQWSTADGTATAGLDYQAVTQVAATFPAGATTTTIGVRVHADRLVEPDETFSVILSQPVNAVLGRAQATGTIVDTDQSSADLEVTVSSDRAVVGPGRRISFQVSVTNLGPDGSTGFAVSGRTTRHQGTILGASSTDGTLTCTTTAHRFDCVAPPGTILLPPTQTLGLLVEVQAPSTWLGVGRTGLAAGLASATPPDPVGTDDRDEAIVAVFGQ